jgi:response regulator RpfG family c-di-GMP phosphodiesterase
MISDYKENPPLQPEVLALNFSEISDLHLNPTFSNGVFKVKHIQNIESGLKILEHNKAYPVILFSDNNIPNFFENHFIQRCENLAPLSSRVLISSGISRGELRSQVSTSKIQSYCCESPSLRTESVKSAISIGYKFHINNLVWNYIKSFEIKTTYDQEYIKTCENIIELISFSKQIESQLVDVTDRELESKLLSIHDELILENIPSFRKNWARFEKTLNKKTAEKEQIRTKKIIEKNNLYVENNFCFIELLSERLNKNKAHLFDVSAKWTKRVKKLRGTFC